MTDSPIEVVTEKPGPVVHIAGNWARVRDRIRQRCGWCGTCLIDMDIPVASKLVLPGAGQAQVRLFQPGSLVTVDGVKSSEYGPATELPMEACGNLPFELTQ